MSDKVQKFIIETPNALQLLNLSNRVGKAVCRYMISGKISKERFSQIKGSDVDEMGKKIAHELIQLVPDEIITAKELLEKYFEDIFNLRINLDKAKFSNHTDAKGFMAVPPQLNEDQIFDRIVSKYGVEAHKYLSPVAKKINRSAEQKRPKGLYVFGHCGGDEPDAEHLGESYDDAIKADYPFANAKEYLLITGFHRFTKGYFMDKKGWTRTSSLWSDGSLVDGIFYETSDLLDLSNGSRVKCDPDYGSRELFLS